MGKLYLYLFMSLSRSKCEETNYMNMSPPQGARRNDCTDRGNNKYRASVENFEYFRTTLANRNCMHKEIK